MNISRDVEDAIPYNQTEMYTTFVGAGVPDRPTVDLSDAMIPRSVGAPPCGRPTKRTYTTKLNGITIVGFPKNEGYTRNFFGKRERAAPPTPSKSDEHLNRATRD